MKDRRGFHGIARVLDLPLLEYGNSIFKKHLKYGLLYQAHPGTQCGDAAWLPAQKYQRVSDPSSCTTCFIFPPLRRVSVVL